MACGLFRHRPYFYRQCRNFSNLIREKCPVGGEWIGAASGKTFDVTNPVNGAKLCSVPDMDGKDTVKAIDAAYDSFQSWRKTTAKERSNLLRKWYDLCVDHHEELAKILTLEQGKPLAEAKGEITYGISFIEWFAEEARRINGDVIPSPASSKQMLFIREPIGVAGMITPWNFPNAMITRKVGAALASGCTAILKPANETPLSALALAVLAEQAGIPKGVFNIVTTSSSTQDVGDAICLSPKIGAMSFTGSTRVGKHLYKRCASTVKKISLELGGNAPFIVFDSADVDSAVAGCMASKFRNAGQTCVSTNRVLVQSGVYDEFLGKMKAAMETQIKVGNGMTPGITQGPLVNLKQFQTVSNMVKEAVDKGGQIVMGGAKHEFGDLYYQPTIVSGMTPDMEIYKDEIFGPVVSMMKFETEDEAIKIANDTRVGLAAYFYSNDVKQCWRVAKSIESGMVGINEGMISAAEAAFGGVKESGIGREGSKYGIDEYTEIKYLCFGNL